MSSSPDSPPPSSAIKHRQNYGTMLPHNLAAWHDKMRHQAIAPEQAYQRARLTEQARFIGKAFSSRSPLEREELPVGYRIYVVTGDVVTSRNVGVERGEHLVIGRHTSCDLVFDADPAISLRHVLVRSFAMDDGLSVLSILDLDSASGFELSDGSRQRSIVGSGPILFRMGATWFVALPKGEQLPPTLDRPFVRHADAGSWKVNPRRDDLHVQIPCPRMPTSRITSIPWAGSLSNRSVRNYNTAQINDAPFELMIDSDGLSSIVCFSERDLEHGILLGRDEKCVDAGLRMVMSRNMGISRVHALIIRERNGITLYDVASMNGTSDGFHSRIRSMPLTEQRGEATPIFITSGAARTAMRWRVLR